MAKAKNTAITGSLVIQENDNLYNRLLFVFPAGEIQFYDKQHLFTLAGESKIYTAGNDKLIIEYKGWKICYDLVFPFFARNVAEHDLLIYVANWSEIRIQAWDALLKARALENMNYVVGVNIIDKSNNKFEYNGHPQVADSIRNYILESVEANTAFILELNNNTSLIIPNKNIKQSVIL